MKRRTANVVACPLALSLAFSAGVVPKTASAAGKKPTLTPKNGATIIKGKTKKFKIKNVKKSNVKKLTVKVFNKSVAKVTKNKKTSFVVKGIGGGLSDMEVVLKLKKAQAGKKKFKFTNLTIASGVKDAPLINLCDDVTGNNLTAMVLKAGTTADFDNIDNQLTLEIYNKDDIGGRNMYITWYEDGKEKEEWSRDAAGGENQRPDTPEVSGSALELAPPITELPVSDGMPMPVSGSPISLPAISGSAVAPSGSLMGFVEKEYYCVVENTLSHKKSTSNVKKFRMIPQVAIDGANTIIRLFMNKYPEVVGLPTDSASMEAYLKDFRFIQNTFGYALGVTPELLKTIQDGINETRNTPDVAAENIANDVDGFLESFLGVGKYLGINEDGIKAYMNHFGYVVTRALADSTIDITKLFQ